ncbi:MAG: ribosomal L7Ae/L30e/S12e/Gadd45 family protein [Oscillospiraceae bacterium]|nr:ribosomal L7Ae/L30e/S12e/Gadd45 family protein [Oscillospiraceae bacterium]
MSNILNLVSLTRKAGKLEVGEEPTAAAARSRQAKLILVAQDAADNTYRRVRHLGDSGNVTWVSVPYTKAQLGHAIGRGETAVMAVMDIGLAAAIVRGLAQDDPEKFAIPLERLTVKNEKAQRRLREKRQHEKNLKNGTYQAKRRVREQKSAEQPNPPEPQQKAQPGHGPSKARSFHKGPRPAVNHSGRKRHTKGSGRSNRYEEFGPSGKPRPGHHKSRES